MDKHGQDKTKVSVPQKGETRSSGKVVKIEKKNISVN